MFTLTVRMYIANTRILRSIKLLKTSYVAEH